jgi:hypothetical protein
MTVTPEPPQYERADLIRPLSPYQSAHSYVVLGTPYVPLLRPASALAVWALVTGVTGLLAGWCLFGVPCLIAVILGHIALHETKDGEKTGRGMAVAGLILGYVALLPAVILAFWLILGAGGAAVAPNVHPSVRVS